MAKYIFVTGGVVSGLGKGMTAAAIGMLLKARGLKVTVQKFDPYMNVDPGTMSPLQHGEVFVTADGTEADLDLGHYERFIDVELNKNSSMTSGKVYLSVLEKERKGDYLGGTVQIIPHVTNEIKRFIKAAGEEGDSDIIITEIGGTVGDLESLAHIETIRQIRSELGKENTLFIHVTLVPVIDASGEIKTKPTQHSVKELRGFGIQPDIIVCRSHSHLDDEAKAKIALFCDVSKEAVIEDSDVPTLYDLPMLLHAQNVDSLICKQFNLETKECDTKKWEALIKRVKKSTHEVEIALVGKYVALHDAYLSIMEALKHAGFKYYADVKIRWIDSTDLDSKNVDKLLSGVNGILVPGGFGYRGAKGKMIAIKYARENKIPFLGICYGMQLACVEFAKNVLGYKDAASSEWEEIQSKHHVVVMMDELNNVLEKGGTMRLGSYPCYFKEGSLIQKLYGTKSSSERHRHRYEVNPDYTEEFESNGLIFSGTSKDKKRIEMIELKDHPFFVATQAHPEFQSRPIKPHPIFAGFVEAILDYQKKHN